MSKNSVRTFNTLQTHFIQYSGLIASGRSEEPHSNRHTDGKTVLTAAGDSAATHPLLRIGGPWMCSERQMVS